jgi:hypothetical protein
MRVVLDTNILVSALMMESGNPATIYSAWQQGYFTLLTCAGHLDELRATLQKPRIAERIQPHKAGRLVNELKDLARPSIRCRAWNAPPIPTTITCWLCPKQARRIISSQATRVACSRLTVTKARGSSPRKNSRRYFHEQRRPNGDDHAG